jgi:hypothetical protein
MFVIGLCDELMTLPEESCRLWCVAVCDLETSWMCKPWPPVGLSRQKQENKLQLTKLYYNAVYRFKYWYSLKVAINNSRNVKECYRVQDWVQFVGDKLVCNFTSFTKIEIYLVSKNACVYVVWPSVYNFLMLWYVDTSLHILAHASIARIQRETEMALSVG